MAQFPGIYSVRVDPLVLVLGRVDRVMTTPKRISIFSMVA
ncbi:hypothetical protein GFS31_39770 [Leptolyngbya sp. BL0902]|nr:hypothetical protein GFS31_39770 [Leptolyngbya sp. BL0902]